MEVSLNINPIANWLAGYQSPLIVAGPCSLENEYQALETARQLACDQRVHIYRGGVWKPRTRPGLFEGVGPIGLDWLQMVKKETGLLVGTEIANAQHTEEALKAGMDVLWIGARSTASPFVVQEIADVLRGTDSVVMVKNPVNPDVQLWIGAFERLSQVGIKNLVAVHRGYTPFGESEYRNYPNWKTVIELRQFLPNLPILCDPSHLAGKREFVYEIAQKAYDMGLDGLMIESHLKPDAALSDKEQQITPKSLQKLLDRLVVRQQISQNKEFEAQLDFLRSRIDAIDSEMLEIIAARMEIVRQIGACKKQNNIMALQIDRWLELIDNRVSLGKQLHLDEAFVNNIFQLIHEDAIRLQAEILNSEPPKNSDDCVIS